MTVLLTNAYSRLNAGDGLLVDLSLGVLESAGISEKPRPSLIAVDPPSFSSLPVVGAPGHRGLRRPSQLTELLGAMAGRPLSRHVSLHQGADLQLAVGGGYLRFGSRRESLVTTAVHVSQLYDGSMAGTPTVLLPQSIGPLKYAPKRLFQVLRQSYAVCVRDDRSARDLARLPNVHRMPDLAVQEVGFVDPLPPQGSGLVGLVIRELPGFDQYMPRVRALLEVLGDRALPLLQSDTGRGNRDSNYMRNFGIRPRASLQDAVKEHVVDAVISVRMHGSLQTILGGIPSVHLAYERKGFSAYEDLGLHDWVHHAGRFDPEVVARQAMALTEDSSEYWPRIADRAPGLRAARAELEGIIRNAIAQK